MDNNFNHVIHSKDVGLTVPRACRRFVQLYLWRWPNISVFASLRTVETHNGVEYDISNHVSRDFVLVFTSSAVLGWFIYKLNVFWFWDTWYMKPCIHSFFHFFGLLIKDLWSRSFSTNKRYLLSEENSGWKREKQFQRSLESRFKLQVNVINT